MGRAEDFEASGRGQTYNFSPDAVVRVTDESSPLYDPRVHERPSRAFIDDIKRRGVKIPAIVTQRVDDKGGRFIGVVCGRSRFWAQAIATAELTAEAKPWPGKPRSPQSKGEVPAILINDLTDEEIRELIIMENEMRRADTLAGRMHKANALFDEMKATADAEELPFREADALKRIAATFGVPVVTVKRWRMVPTLSAPARKAILSGAAPLGQVDDLVNMSPACQLKAVEQAVAAGASSTKAARKASGDVPQAKPEKQARRSRKAIETKIAELDAELAKTRPSMMPGRTAQAAALRWALGEDTL